MQRSASPTLNRDSILQVVVLRAHRAISTEHVKILEIRHRLCYRAKTGDEAHLKTRSAIDKQTFYHSGINQHHIYKVMGCEA